MPASCIDDPDQGDAGTKALIAPAKQIGIDFGGSKIEITVLYDCGGMMLRRRMTAPAHYDDTIAVLARQVRETETEPDQVGFGFPGRVNRPTGLLRNANCFALSESVDSAGLSCRR